MLVCVWGYDNDANAKGGWPTGFAEVARSKGYFNGISDEQNKSADRSMVALMIYNSLKG